MKTAQRLLALPQRYQVRSLSSLELYSGAHSNLKVDIPLDSRRVLQCTVLRNGIFIFHVGNVPSAKEQELRQLGEENGCVPATWEFLFAHGPSTQEVFAPGSPIRNRAGLHFPCIRNSAIILAHAEEVSGMNALFVAPVPLS